ncbi:MAG: hypothetical protein VX589_08520 [Myxococcota bacterium]|nr:hypothetical protein [Myxococcota bacterium]
MVARLVLMAFAAIAVLLFAIVFQPTTDGTSHGGESRANTETSTATQPATEPVKQSPIRRPKAPAETRPRTDLAWPEKRVREQGLMGRSESWIKPVMDQPHWTIKPRADAPYRFINRNDVALEWAVKHGRVIGATVHFPDNAVSADLTALSEFFVGQSGFFPVHFESMTKKDTRYGTFEAADGTRLYYRGTYRRDGPPTYGPASFEIQVGPFPDQPVQYGAHPDEHLTPLGDEQ